MVKAEGSKYFCIGEGARAVKCCVALPLYAQHMALLWVF